MWGTPCKLKYNITGRKKLQFYLVCERNLLYNIYNTFGVDAGVAEWQTHRTQNAAGNRVGSSPTTGTIKGQQKRCPAKNLDFIEVFCIFRGYFSTGYF